MHRGIFTCRKCGGMALSSYDMYVSEDSVDLWKGLGNFRSQWKRKTSSPAVSLLLVCAVLTAITGLYAHSNNLLNEKTLAFLGKHDTANDKPRKLSSRDHTNH